jgi:hypothetical protein
MYKVYKIKFYAKSEKLEERYELAAWYGHVQRFVLHACLFDGWESCNVYYTDLGGRKSSDYSRFRRAIDRMID